MKHHTPRSATIDLFRAIAILLMIIYHLAWDLQNYYGWNINVQSTPWKVLERGTAGLFLFLVGLCFVISYTHIPDYTKFLKRGLMILGFGMMVSIATYIMDPVTYVRFGILHLIGVATLLLPIFAPLRFKNELIAAVIISLAYFDFSGSVSTSLLLPLGLTPPHFMTVDYFPIIPWFGVILIGLTAGFVYVRMRDPSEDDSSPKSKQQKTIEYVSRHSLAIYMVHQPLLVIVLKLMLGRSGL